MPHDRLPTSRAIGEGARMTEGWNVVDEERGILWREYPFTKGAYATTLVVRGPEGLIVVSPGAGLDARAFDALREHGEVRALVANNTFHHLGQKDWRARFPDATSHCPSAAITTLAKKAPGVPWRPLSDLASGAGARFHEPPGFKTGETIVQVDTKRGAVWWSGDLLANIQRMPGPPIRWLFSLTDSAPGFRLFKLAVWTLVKDRAAVRDALLRELDAHPPAIVVPAHGPPVDTADVAERARAQLKKL
ncbi:hypothetical protein DB32_002119 [Sandaracinus amylolyticus]|uniref:MBL fold metallo-hydrolase n=2 Tax=Sandaracinus amylolyticus TaxID=927083 RepID=A0A0F6YGQ3_9BACT|nr:hypothetical protein DB32_002119 [Sandaracinus amylolyticus]